MSCLIAIFKIKYTSSLIAIVKPLLWCRNLEIDDCKMQDYFCSEYQLFTRKNQNCMVNSSYDHFIKNKNKKNTKLKVI